MFDLNRLYNADCMEAMKEIPDGFFQLAICDPPYGIGHDGQRKRVHNNVKHNRKFHARKGWDRETPPPEYFRELERVSENQIIFGGNYFAPMLKRGTKGWVVWDKGQHGLSMSDCELAYSSFDCPTRVVVINRAELQRDGDTIHPTQKPVRLYEWILRNYARPGDRILDTHAGSASSLIACWRQGFEFVGFEIDRDYYKKASERLAVEMAQIRLWDYDAQTKIEDRNGGINMRAGAILIVVYWAIFTVKRHFTPRLTAAIKANTYDLNRNDPEAKRAAQRKRGPLTAAKWALRVAGWAENVLITLVLAWLVFVVGTVLTGTVVVFGKPL